MCINIWFGSGGIGIKEDRAKLPSVLPIDRTRGNGRKLNYRKFHLNLGKHCFYSGGGQTLAEIAQRDCEVSIFAVIQDLTEHDPEQPAPADTAWVRTWTWESREVPFSLSNNLIHWVGFGDQQLNIVVCSLQMKSVWWCLKKFLVSRFTMEDGLSSFPRNPPFSYINNSWTLSKVVSGQSSL